MSRLVTWIEAFAASLGGPGLFVVAFLDSSFISLPEINDVLVVMMVARDETLMPYYAAMATSGSVCGCLVLYAIGRRGGEVLLRKRFGGPRLDRAMHWFRRLGVLAVLIPALLPPPAPFKVFVLLSGVTRMPLALFGGAVAVGRGVRYFGEGALAVRYGDEAISLLETHGASVSLVVAGVALIAVVTWVFMRRRRSTAPETPPVDV
ncbi:MAG: VTT domain-containing protein [Acidobacteria bacterium]|nr:VTT domain-containing protein [Acidobacteriota bacterium]